MISWADFLNASLRTFILEQFLVDLHRIIHSNPHIHVGMPFSSWGSSLLEKFLD